MQKKTRIVHLKNIFLVTWLPITLSHANKGFAANMILYTQTCQTCLLSVVVCRQNWGTEMGTQFQEPSSKPSRSPWAPFTLLLHTFRSVPRSAQLKRWNAPWQQRSQRGEKFHPWLGFTVSVFEDTRLWQSAFSDVTKETAPFPRPVTTPRRVFVAPLVLVPFQHWAFLTWSP